MPKIKKAAVVMIAIRGKKHNIERFKPISVDESEIPGILEGLRDFGNFAKTHSISDSEYPPGFLGIVK